MRNLSKGQYPLAQGNALGEIGLKGQYLLAQGNALGICNTNNQRPVRAASSMKLTILPLQGATTHHIKTQGDALGYERVAPSGRIC